MRALLSEFLDRTLHWRTSRSLEAHLEGCPPCRVFVASIEQTILLYRERPVVDVPAHVRGHLRDLLHILAEVLLRTDTLPVPPATVEQAVDQVKNEFLPLADADAIWLDRVARTHKASLEGTDRLPDLARFLDTHLMLCYRNGHEWYDVHPLIADEVREQAERAAARSNGTPG